MTLIDKAEALAALRAAGILRDEAYDAIRTLPARGVGVKPLDLPNVLKHAFLSGVVAAREIEAGEPCVGADLWVEYDPTGEAAYNRILAALAPTDAAQAREAALREAAAAWEAFKGATISDDHFAAVERLDAAFALIGERP